jgi:TPR repeat protein
MENKESINKQNEENAGKKIAFTCPFCREPDATGPEHLRRLQARCLQNDRNAFMRMGSLYLMGKYGLAKDDLKAFDCWIRAIELGSPEACTCIAGFKESKSNGTAIDKERTNLFRRVGALRGDIGARQIIGRAEYKLGNHEIAIRHWKIAAEAGLQESLNELRDIYNADGKFPGKEFISKEEMDTVYRSGHEAQMEIKSEKREKHGYNLMELGKKKGMGVWM